MYIESIEIHFTTKKAPIQVVGGSAQELFDQKAYHNDVVEVTVDGEILEIGYYDDADIPIYTQNPDIIGKTENLFALQDELEKILAGDRNVC